MALQKQLRQAKQLSHKMLHFGQKHIASLRCYLEEKRNRFFLKASAPLHKPAVQQKLMQADHPQWNKELEKLRIPIFEDLSTFEIDKQLTKKFPTPSSKNTLYCLLKR